MGVVIGWNIYYCANSPLKKQQQKISLHETEKSLTGTPVRNSLVASLVPGNSSTMTRRPLMCKKNKQNKKKRSDCKFISV